jgi:hypothetical protein
MSKRIALSLATSLLLAALTLSAEKEETPEEHAVWIKANYTKYEHMIPMRDGVKLFTSVYAPKDDSKPYPIMLTRTPYSVSPYGVNSYKTSIGPSRQFAKDLFIFAYQDVRGRMGSEGEFVNVRPYKPVKSGPQDIDETTDTYDTVDWLVKNVPNNNGKAGQWGISYPGFYAAMGAIDAHPAMKASSPQAPVTDWFIGDDFHHNGAFYLAHAFRFFWRFGMPVEEPTRNPVRTFDFKTPDGYEFFLNLGPLTNLNERFFKNEVPFWNEMTQHTAYDDFWKERDLRVGLKNIKPAVMTVGGWFDAEDLFGPLKVYETIEKTTPGAHNMLVMGPWYHGQWAGNDGDKMGHVPFNAKTSLFYREKIELPFFKHYLKDEPGLDLPDAYVFETGTNQWRRYDTWPPKAVTEKTLYFHNGGVLSFDPPAETGNAAHDEYISDPAKPVPFIPNVSIGMTREHMLDDQRFASSRTDVLVYMTDLLEEDITIAGPITPSMHVSTTGTDSDWVVKLIDVYSGDFPNPNPNPAGVEMGGYQQLVRGEAMRGRFRNSFEKPEPFEPGKVSKVEYIMPDAYHTFRRGHRIMVHVQSSWFPLIDRNPQKFVDIYNAKKEDFQKATQRVYRSKQAPSSVRLTILPRPKP